MIDLESFKGATLDDDTFAKLKGGFDDLVSQRDAARQESINGRRGKDQKLTDATKQIETLRERIEAFAERLGVDADVELDALPDVKGQADAAKQFEAKLRRVERENADLKQAAADAAAKTKAQTRAAAIKDAVSKHQFKNAADAEILLGARVREEGESWMFETEGGRLVPLDEGVLDWATKRPDYLKPSDAGGSGSGFRAGAAGGSKVMQRAQFDSLGPKEQAKAVAEGYSIND